MATGSVYLRRYNTYLRLVNEERYCVKFALHMAIFLAVLFSLSTTAGAKSHEPVTKTCLHNLAWQRWSYTKAHVNNTQSIQQRVPDVVHWNSPNSQLQCHGMVSRARSLRLAEQSRWSRLRLQKAGVKWIIRKQFQRAGHDIVLHAWKVVSCESNFRPNAKSSTGDLGTWQINQVHNLSDAQRTSPEYSTGWAWRASEHGTNFSPTWVCASHYNIP